MEREEGKGRERGEGVGGGGGGQGEGRDRGRRGTEGGEEYQYACSPTEPTWTLTGSGRAGNFEGREEKSFLTPRHAASYDPLDRQRPAEEREGMDQETRTTLHPRR